MSTIAELTPAPVSEGARRATVDAGARAREGAPDPEVTERAKRRRAAARKRGDTPKPNRTPERCLRYQEPSRCRSKKRRDAPRSARRECASDR